MTQTDIFRNSNCLGQIINRHPDESVVEIPHDIVFQPMKTQQSSHPTIENCIIDSVVEGVMYCRKCGLITPDTIDYGEN